MSLLLEPARSDPPTPRSTGHCCVEASSPRPGTLLLRVHGEIDLCTIGLVDDALASVLHRTPDHLVVDLTGTRFCGLRGLALLVTAAATAAGLGVGLSVCGASAQAVRVWSLLWEPAQRPPLHPDVATAVCAARPGGEAAPAGEAAFQHRVTEPALRVDVAQQGLGIG